MAAITIPPQIEPRNDARTAYFAGLFDAEGYAGIHANETSLGKPYPAPRLMLGMASETTVVAFASYFGAGTIHVRAPRNPKHLIIFSWEASSRKALSIALDLAQFCIAKREPLSRIIACYDQAMPSQRIDHRAAYFAGLIDGDGHVGIQRMRRRGEGFQLVPRIMLGMTSEPTVTACANYFGFGTSWKKPPKNPQHKMMHWWQASCGDARTVAAALLPHSLTKPRELAEIVDLPIAKLGPIFSAARDYTKLMSQDTLERLRLDHAAAVTAAEAIGKARVKRGWIEAKAQEMGIDKRVIHAAIYYHRNVQRSTAAK